MLYVGALMALAVVTYEPRDPSSTVLYKVIAEHLETFLASLDDDHDAKGLPAYVQREFYDYLQCGILAHGFLRLGCDTCKREMLLVELRRVARAGNRPDVDQALESVRPDKFERLLPGPVGEAEREDLHTCSLAKVDAIEGDPLRSAESRKLTATKIAQK